MAEVLYYAVPAFVLLLAVEWISFVIARNEALVGYDPKDTATSLSMGIGNVIRAIARDVHAARSGRERWGYMLRGPGWAPQER